MKQHEPVKHVARRNASFEELTSRTAMRSTVAPALVLVALLNAACYPLITVGLRFAPILPFAALRAFIAGVALAMLAGLLHRPMPRELRIWSVLVAIGLATTSLGYLGMFHAAEYVSPGLATVIGNSQPLIAALLAQIFLRERLHLHQLLGLLFGFGGIVAISLPQLAEGWRAGFAVGVGYIILATGGLAIGNVLMKTLGARVDPLVAMAAQLLFGAAPLAIAAAIRGQHSAIMWTPVFLASLVGLALPGTAFAYWLWFTSLERAPLNRANAFTFLTPFVGFGLGIAFFGERPRLVGFIGLLFTLAGIALVQRGSASRPE